MSSTRCSRTGSALHINPQIADAFGLKILAVGVVATVVGFVITRSSKKS